MRLREASGMEERYDAALFDLFGTLVSDEGVAVHGARELLGRLPEGSYAIVTSCPRQLAQRLIAHAGLPAPAVLVCADEVERNKPAPDGYLLAASQLRAAPTRCLVVEDSTHGVAAGVAAGMTVLALARGKTLPARGDVRVIGALAEIDLDVHADGTLLLRAPQP